jgi:hypothetical protein
MTGTPRASAASGERARVRLHARLAPEAGPFDRPTAYPERGVEASQRLAELVRALATERARGQEHAARAGAPRASARERPGQGPGEALAAAREEGRQLGVGADDGLGGVEGGGLGVEAPGLGAKIGEGRAFGVQGRGLVEAGLQGRERQARHQHREASAAKSARAPEPGQEGLGHDRMASVERNAGGHRGGEAVIGRERRPLNRGPLRGGASALERAAQGGPGVVQHLGVALGVPGVARAAKAAAVER